MTNQNYKGRKIIILQNYALSIGCTNYLNCPKEQREAVAQLDQLLLDIAIEAKPEKRQTEADKLRAKGQRIVGSSPFIDAENDAYNQAIDEFITRIKQLVGGQDG
jgi:hypothetical protein